MIDLSNPDTLSTIQAIGYPSMLILMILEGPIATILAAFSASLGFFNVYMVLLLSIAGDIIGDLMLYFIGYTGGSKALAKWEKLLKVKPATVEKIERLFSAHGKKTVFAVKSTTGLCWIAFITAGAVKMKLGDFLLASFFGGIIWSSFLVISGYFFGYAFNAINEYIQYAGILVFISVAVFFAGTTFYKKRQSQKIIQQ